MTKIKMKNKTEKLRVWWFRNDARNLKYYPVENVKEAIKKINQLADEDLHDRGVVMNGFGLEIYKDYRWEEYYYDKAGYDIEQIMEKE